MSCREEFKVVSILMVPYVCVSEMLCYTVTVSIENLEQNTERHKYESLCSVL
jgi:hypothetical protein